MRPATFSMRRFAAASRRDALEGMALLPAAPLARPRFGIPLLVVQDFEAARRVLIDDEGSYGKPWFVRNIISDGLGPNLFTAEGEEWLARRRPVAKVFAAPAMNGLAGIIADTVAVEMSGWSPGTDDFQQRMTDLTLRVAFRALLGTDTSHEDLRERVRSSFAEVLAWITYRFEHLAAPPAVVPTGRNRRMKAARGELRSAVRALVERRRAEAEADIGAGPAASNRAGGPPDVLGQLLEGQRHVETVTDDDIVDECIGFLFAGHETTAATLTWALYELATHTEDQERVAAEGALIRPDASGLHDLSTTLTHTGRVVEETLRLHPAGVSIARSARRSTALLDHDVRRGTLIMIAVYSMQRSEAAWDRPDEFDPWRDQGSGATELRDSYLPFGLGPRRCLGARFARTEMRLALAMICARWTLAYEAPSPPRPKVSPSLRVDGGLPIVLTSRDPGP